MEQAQDDPDNSDLGSIDLDFDLANDTSVGSLLSWVLDDEAAVADMCADTADSQSTTDTSDEEAYGRWAINLAATIATCGAASSKSGLHKRSPSPPKGQTRGKGCCCDVFQLQHRMGCNKKKTAKAAARKTTKDKKGPKAKPCRNNGQNAALLHLLSRWSRSKAAGNEKYEIGRGNSKHVKVILKDPPRTEPAKAPSLRSWLGNKTHDEF
ncbi:hypothetical protein CP532_5328 [Ophiocordyceps camponoti-leonardi (nom. inval.)]|nr:hypothetical protein CP532_5328 [Ophiocordyceps camponoti-leonardi (nom. inval.)]